MISTKRLILRRVRADDLEDLHDILSSPDAMRYWDRPPHTNIDETRAFLDQMVGAAPDTSDDFILELHHRVIGKAGCFHADELGFILHPDHWGKGLAFEALSAIIPHIFDTLQISRLKADVDPRNAASLKLLGRLGFTETHRATRTLLVGEEWCDSVYLELRRPTVSL
jgi:RimJ/RimL family protein N-acetyltransferase